MCEHHTFMDFVSAHPILAFGDLLIMWIIWCLTMIYVTRELRKRTRV